MNKEEFSLDIDMSKADMSKLKDLLTSKLGLRHFALQLKTGEYLDLVEYKDYEKLEKELEQLKEIEKEHRTINGELRVEIKELKEKYMKLEDKYIHNVSCCNEEDCDLFCEHQELKLELSGYRQAILEDKDMLGLKEENQSLKKQLEEERNKVREYSYKLSNYRCEETYETQQKEFIEYLEYLQKKLNDMHLAPDIEKILSKYKEIIGDKE